MPKQPILTPQSEDFPAWYQDVINKAELADNGPVRGTMVIRPYAYGIWERIQAELDLRIKAAGAENAYFPIFIPESFLKKEAEHVEGFAPELAIVTHGGGKKLEEPVVVRPTSETVINHFFSKWVQSHRDLPLLINQWANVVRWEMRPRIFLRTTEFLWQEGHTAHATQQDAHEYALRILQDAYYQVMADVMAVPVHLGRKIDEERFAGADVTWSCEGMMRDGKALQMGTSHELGQNFAKAFDIQFLSAQGDRQYAWQTSWGASTRLMGGLIMAHGDDNGLRVPPLLAPTQVIVMVVRDEDGSGAKAAAIVDELKAGGSRASLDDRVDTSFGRRAVDWELKGIPLRIEVGPRELAEGQVTIARRDTGTKESVSLDKLNEIVPTMLVDIQASMLREATERRDANTHQTKTLAETIEAGSTGFAHVAWDTIRNNLAELTAAKLTVRCLQREDGSLPAPDQDKDLFAYVGRSY